MITVIGIRFKKACKIYYFDPLDMQIEKDDFAIVETVRGVEFGAVVIGPRQVPESEVVQPLKPVLRKATPEDIAKDKENKRKEKDAFNICEEKIKAHALEMRLIGVEYTFDVNKIIFFFTADGRIDFRELVKDLAAIFRTRIELRQIGVRDQAKALNGIGSCGRPLCCATFLGDFEPVSIRMAKDQNLSLNPTKISGVCSRLMCCLKYENHLYTCGKNGCCAEKTVVLKAGTKVLTPLGEGVITRVNKQTLSSEVKLAGNNIVTVAWDEMTDISEVDII